MNVLDLFSGIGGFSLGLERAGMRTVAFCEIDPYCRAVLRKHWPNVPIFEDVRTLTGADVPGVDVICGGFPCQDVSVAGKRAGLDGTRSGLWVEFARIIREIQPRFVVVENTPGLLSLGMGTVLGDLADLGFDAEWRCISASEVGADHIRERVWIVAYLNGMRELQREGIKSDERGWPDNGIEEVANLDGERLQERLLFAGIQGQARCDDDGQNITVGAWRSAESPLVRGLHGIPGRVDRIKALGNAVVPQIPEIIGRAIMKAAA